MATYSIPAPDGHTYTIEGPEGASQEQVQAEVMRQFPQAIGGGEQAPAEPDAQSPSSIYNDRSRAVERTPIPEAMQAESNAWLAQNDPRLNPQGYTAMRVALDKKYGMRSDPEAYLSFAKGLKPGQHLSIIPDPARFSQNDQGIIDTALVDPQGNKAVARGAADFVGGAGEVGAVIDSLIPQQGRENVWNSDRSISDIWSRNHDIDEAVLSGDEENHPVYRGIGQLLGNLVIPAGMEGVAFNAGKAALKGGATMQEARAVAAAATRNQLMKVGGALGGSAGFLGADGDLGDRAEGAASGAVAGMAGGYAGAKVAPYAGKAAQAVGKALDRAKVNIDDFASVFTSEGAKKRAAELLQSAASDSTSSIVQRIENAPIPVSGAKPTLAEVASDAGLAGFQRGHANTDMATQAAISARHAENSLARSGAASGALDEGVAPQAMQDLAQGQMAAGEAATTAAQQQVNAASESRIATEAAGATKAQAEAQQRAGQGVAAIGETADRAATGATARDTFEAAHDAAKAVTREAYAAPALTLPQPIEVPRSLFKGFMAAADDFFGDGGGEMSGKVQAILSDLAEPKGATTRTLTNVDRRLADFAGEARIGGRKSEAAFAERLRADLGAFVDQNAPPEYRVALKAAKAARADQGARFETGDVAKAFARDRFGNPVVGDTTIPSRLARPGAPGGDTADRLIASVGADKAETFVRQELRRAIEEGGVSTAAKADAIVTKYGEMAKRFPGLEKDLGDLRSHFGLLDAATEAATAAEKAAPTAAEKLAMTQHSALEEGLRASPMAKLADSATDPSSFVAQLLRRSDDGRQLTALHSMIRKSPEAVSGLRRALGDFIVNMGVGNNFTAAGEQVPSISKLRSAIATVVGRSGDIITPQQKFVLKGIERELQNANFAATASKPAGSETAINKTFVEVMEHVPGIKAKMLNKVIEVLGNQNEVRALLTQSILDPEFAAALLKRPTAQHWIKVREGLITAKAAPIVGAHQGDNLLSAVNDNFARVAADKRKDDPNGVQR